VKGDCVTLLYSDLHGLADLLPKSCALSTRDTAPARYRNGVYISNTVSHAIDFTPLDRREGPIVERCVAHARRYRLTAVARLITRAGNGWLYPIASLLLFAVSLQHAARCVVTAAISLAIAFTLYPPLKRFLGRARPCHNNVRIADALQPLDRHSFPSGHAMTAAAFGVPIIVAAPPLAIPIVIGGCALVSWSRIALGHHYLSDIVAGTVIGASIAAVVTFWTAVA